MWRTVGVAAEKAESRGCMLLTGAGEIAGVECAIGVSGLEQVFFFFSTALIRGWPAVFTSAARSGKWLARDRKWLLMRGGVMCSRLPER